MTLFQQPVNQIAALLATGFGIGLAPFAPGTFGTLVGVPLAIWVNDWGHGLRLVFWGALLGVGTWATKVFSEAQGTSDDSRIVIDEIVGYGIAAWLANPGPRDYLLAFLFFRFFDVLKPPPICWLDRWSKHQRGWLGGFGIMADDLLAGVLSLALLWVTQRGLA